MLKFKLGCYNKAIIARADAVHIEAIHAIEEFLN